MKQFSNYASISYDNDSKQYSNVMFDLPNFSEFKEDYRVHTITESTEFRPDKIASIVFEDDTLSWVLDEINGLSRLSNYTRGKDIFYLPYQIVAALLGL